MNSIFTNAYSITIKQQLSRISCRNGFNQISYRVSDLFRFYKNHAHSHIFLTKIRVKLF